MIDDRLNEIKDLANMLTFLSKEHFLSQDDLNSVKLIGILILKAVDEIKDDLVESLQCR